MRPTDAPIGYPLDEQVWGQAEVRENCYTDVPGYWTCLSHGVTLVNNNAMGEHMRIRRVHLVAWLCTVHGVETP